jgi:adenosylcobinamide-GDP ribazoletransferase
MTPRAELLRDIIADLRIAVSFVTILPVASSKPAGDGAIARATWALPVAGLVVGLAGALVYAIASRFGLAPNLAALLALAATALVTGALHEDGLADTADGLGGGRTRERKLEIMRDSRIGTYGVCALILSFGLRWSALAAIANPWAVALALCAAHTAARAGLPAFMSQVAPARPDGLSASAGSPPGRSIAIAFAVGILALVLALGPGKALVSLILLSLAGLMLARLAIRQIGGQTGDILGAFEQTGEILILLVAAAFQIGG